MCIESATNLQPKMVEETRRLLVMGLVHFLHMCLNNQFPHQFSLISSLLQ